MMKSDVFLSLGSNMGDRGANLQAALTDLEKWGVKVLRSSSIYETEPFGNKDQANFYNMVAQVETDKAPPDLLTVIFAIERSLGRVRKEKWGPRTIDIDILYYGDVIYDDGDLMIPHLHLEDRSFVLIPLLEIAPDFIHPMIGKTTEELLKECKDEGKVTLLS